MNKSAQLPHSDFARLLLITLILLGGFGVLSWGATQRNLRDDEGITYAGTSGNLITTLDFQARDVEAPAYFVLINLWQKLIGDAEFPTRVCSVLTSLLTLALVFHLSRRWFKSDRYGIAAIIGLSFSAYFFIYAIEIRPYALMMFSAALSMVAFDRWLRLQSWRSALLYGVTVALMLYVHYLGVSLFLIQGLFYVLHRPFARKLIGQGVLAYAAAFVLFAPWLPIFISQVRHAGQLATDEGTTRIAGLGMAATTLPTNAEYVGRFIQLISNHQPLIYAIIALLGLILLWKKRPYWIIIGYAIGLPVLIFVLNLLVPIYEPRYVAHMVPGLGMLVGISVAAIPQQILRTVGIGALCVLGVLTVTSGLNPGYSIRDLLRSAEAAYQLGDGVFYDGIKPDHLLGPYQFSHYAPSLNALVYAPDADAFGQQLLDPKQTDQLNRCVWFITEVFLDPTVQEHFKTISNRRPLITVIGDTRYALQRLCAPPRNAPTRIGDNLNFLGADQVTGDPNQLNVNLWWSVSAAPKLDYSIGVYVLDASGQLVAQQDGAIRDFWGRGLIQTSALQPNTYYIDQRSISLRSNLAAGTYTVAVAVYQPWDGVRLPVEGKQDGLLTFTTFQRK